MADLTLPYDDFQDGAIIEASEHNANNTAITDHVNSDVVKITGNQTITGEKTFASSSLKLQEAGSTDVATIAVASLAASRTLTVPDPGAAASFVMTEGTQTINGAKTLTTSPAVAPAGAGDAFVRMTVNGGQAWAAGADDSDSDAFVLSASTTPGTTNVMRMSSAGEMNLPLQPAFLVTNGTGASDVTGDGTTYEAVWATEVFDQGGDFASNAFTAPVTGRYQLNAKISIRQIGAAHTSMIFNIVTSNRSYKQLIVQGSQLYSSYMFEVSVLADMDAADTAYINIQINGSTKTCDFDGDAASNNFSGWLVA